MEGATNSRCKALETALGNAENTVGNVKTKEMLPRIICKATKYTGMHLSGGVYINSE